LAGLHATLTNTTPAGEHADVSAAALGDRAAWARLYQRFAPVIHGLLLLTVARREAEELTQEVFMRAMGKLHELKDPAAVGGWLCQIARNEAVSWARSQSRATKRQAQLALHRNDGGATAVDSQLLDAQTVLLAIRTLPEAYRETLVLRLVEGLTGPQIAAATGMTHGSVRVNLTRGMAMLRESLGIPAQEPQP
jgi:RNA polymerase sigma-70 factor (ECF subfamily)